MLWPFILTVMFSGVSVVLLVVLLRRRPVLDVNPLQPQFESLRSGQAAVAQALRDELATHRDAAANQARGLREEVSTAMKGVADSLLKQVSEVARTNEQRLETVRNAVEQQFVAIRADNAIQLEAMRKTVDEKLAGTLERRLGESFQLVSERLELVHKGLGEMQQLAAGVGDLKKVLTNVKTRGTWGEIQLGNLLEQVLSPEQFARNVAPYPQSSERVEFAIKLPGHGATREEVVWLPIDSKFPAEDYHRLVEATERGDLPAADEACRQLEIRFKAAAKEIRDKYLHPPYTTDFGIMFLPTEGLFAEALRRPGLLEFLQREYRVTVNGPTTLAAFLNSLQMGFRTLAIEKRSSEVWQLLGAVKTEFGKFGGVIERVQKKLHEATSTIDDVAVRSRAIEKRLRTVQELPGTHSALLLGATQPVPIEAPLDRDPTA
ncbi:MAG: DNA recombination protein RmuC [Deltaproteobacteria bacterium]|nr:DNA recombination protein RmuC [Deltaproteobacteria bacterium]